MAASAPSCYLYANVLNDLKLKVIAYNSGNVV